MCLYECMIFFLNQGNMYNPNYEFACRKCYWKYLKFMIWGEFLIVQNSPKKISRYLDLFCKKYPNFIRWFPFSSTYCNVKVLEQKKIVDQSTKFNCSSFAKKSLKNQMRNYYYNRTSVFRRDDLNHSSDCEVPCFW